MSGEKEYIELEAALALSEVYLAVKTGEPISYQRVDRLVREHDLRNLPRVTGQPGKTGRWVIIHEGDRARLVECDQCHNSFSVGKNIPHEEWIATDNRHFCGKCGADMRGTTP